MPEYKCIKSHTLSITIMHKHIRNVDTQIHAYTYVDTYVHLYICTYRA